MMSSTLESDEPFRSTDTQREIALLAFEKEFDGIRRAVVRAEEPLDDPSRYWDLVGGGTD